MTEPRRSLRILMLAPEPFFEPRGTPFSEYHRIKALVELGHHVDLVTYPIGADVDLPSLRIFRSGGLPFVRKVRIGPSLVKALLDARLAVTAWKMARRGGYDLVHSHEEAGFFGTWLARRLGVPHLYDMHSSLPQQLSNFRVAFGRWVLPVFERLERRTIDQSGAIITICQALQDQVVAMGAGERSVLIENVMGGQTDEPPTIRAADVRARWGLAPDQPLVLYTGTFEAYQGLDLLMEAAAIVGRARPGARVLVAGGEPAQVAEATDRAKALGAPMVFAGQQPAREIPAFVEASDVLVSPRVSGTNTPLKIYSYLQSGRPIVATSLSTHTQVLDPTVAELVEPTPDAFAAGIIRLIDDPARRRALADAAAALARERYSRKAYLDRTAAAYARLWTVMRPETQILSSSCRPHDGQAAHGAAREEAARGEGVPASDRARGPGRSPGLDGAGMTVLVTGVTGFTGGHLARHLRARGHRVRGLVRPQSVSRAGALAEAGVEIAVGDLTEPATLGAACTGVEVVYHVAATYREAGQGSGSYRAINVDGTRHLLEAARAAGARRFVHCSTGGVHGHVEHPPANEDAPLAPGDIYQRTKLEGEQLAAAFGREHGLEVVIARPIGIHGPGDLRFLKMFRGLARGRFPMLGSGRVFYHLTYIDDLVEGFRLCGEHPAAAGRTYILAGAEYTTLAELVALVAREVGGRPPRVHWPVWPVWLAGALCELVCVPVGVEPPLYRRRVDFYRKSRAFDISRARAELGYNPAVSLQEGIRRTADWYRAQGLL